MSRLSLLVRALLLLPLLAAGVDYARATLVCGPDGGSSCLEAASRGSLGVLGAAVLVALAVLVAAALARLARGGAGLPTLWLLAGGALAAVCGGQALLAGALGDPSLLGGGWGELAGFCVVAGGVLALALRFAPAAAALVRDLRPPAPRILLAAPAPPIAPLAPPAPRRLRFALAAPGRAPPSV